MIQRYDIDHRACDGNDGLGCDATFDTNPFGMFIRYDDHVAALAVLHPIVRAARLVDAVASDLPSQEKYGLLRALEHLHSVCETLDTPRTEGAS